MAKPHSQKRKTVNRKRLPENPEIKFAHTKYTYKINIKTIYYINVQKRKASLTNQIHSSSYKEPSSARNKSHTKHLTCDRSTLVHYKLCRGELGQGV